MFSVTLIAVFTGRSTSGRLVGAAVGTLGEKVALGLPGVETHAGFPRWAAGQAPGRGVDHRT